MRKLNDIYRRNLISFGLVALMLLVLPSQSNAQARGVITSLENRTAQLNWGTVDGMQEGIVLDVYREEIVTHAATGERLGNNEKFIGKIEIIDSQRDHSSANTIEYAEPFQIGDFLKVSYDESVISGNVIQGVEKGTITDVDNTVVDFNMGRFDGVEKNIYFDIFRDEGASIHPVTGAPVAQKRIYIGRLVVTGVEDDHSIGQLIARERDILAGDKVELSLLQPSDLEMLPQQVESVPQTDPFGEIQFEAPPAGAASVGPPSNIIGTVTRVSDKDLFFIWRADYGLPVGRVFGIYRRIEIPHPEKEGVIVDDPLIQIGTATLRESIGRLGKAFVSDSDADILPNDLVGLSDGAVAGLEQVVTPENIQQVYESQSSDILRAAQDLTSQVNQLQGEMFIVRSTLDKIDRIDRELISQRAISRQTNESLEQIKMMLMNEGFALEGFDLPSSRTSVERMEFPGSKTNVLRLQYSDDVGVDFQLVGNRLMVSLSVDSSGVMSLQQSERSAEISAFQPDDTSGTQPGSLLTGSGVAMDNGDEEAEEGSFFTSIFGMLSSFILILLVIAGALYFFILKKKQGAGSAKGDSDDEELEEEELSDDQEEGVEEVLADEEEVESFEDDED